MLCCAVQFGEEAKRPTVEKIEDELDQWGRPKKRLANPIDVMPDDMQVRVCQHCACCVMHRVCLMLDALLMPCCCLLPHHHRLPLMAAGEGLPAARGAVGQGGEEAGVSVTVAV